MSRLRAISSMASLAVLAIVEVGCSLGPIDAAWADTINVYQINNAHCSSGRCGSVTTDLNGPGTILTYAFDLTTGAFAEPPPSSPWYKSTIKATAAIDALGNVTSYSESYNNDAFASWHNVNNPQMGSGQTWLQGVACVTFGGSCDNKLTITIDGTNLGVGSLGNWIAALYFTNAVDCDWYKGVVDASTTPIPGSLALFGSVLGIGFLSLRTKRRQTHPLA
ncbi:MAG: hypothetical protein ACYC5H_11850 [Methylovirgula sp.]